MRQPLEEGRITVSRAARSVVFPVHAGRGDEPVSRAAISDRRRVHAVAHLYRSQVRARISGPLRDRLDLIVEVDAVPISALTAPDHGGEPSAAVRERVRPATAGEPAGRTERAARPRPGTRVRTGRRCSTSSPSVHLSARAYHRVLRVGSVSSRGRHRRRRAPRRGAPIPLRRMSCDQKANARDLQFLFLTCKSACYPASARPYQELMLSNRYTIVVADRRTGVCAGSPIGLAVATTVVTLPVLVGLGAAWKAKAEVANLYAAQAAPGTREQQFPRRDGGPDRADRGAAGGRLGSGRQGGARSGLQSAMNKLPAIVKNRAMGGGGSRTARPPFPGVTREHVRPAPGTAQRHREPSARRELRCRATQSAGRVDAVDLADRAGSPSRTGGRSDPFTGEADYHPGLDISADKGTSVYATAGRDGEPGLLLRGRQSGRDHSPVRHRDPLRPSLGVPRQAVRRGDLIGLVGATGRATGPHLHYEVRVNDRILNPLQFLLNPRRSAATRQAWSLGRPSEAGACIIVG